VDEVKNGKIYTVASGGPSFTTKSEARVAEISKS
jgi:hypothetical protein